MPAKTRASTQNAHCTVTRPKTKMDCVSQPNNNSKKRKRVSSGDGGGLNLAPEEQHVAIGDAITSTPRKKPTPHKTVAESTDLRKELNRLRKDYSQVQAENLRIKEHNKTLEEARDADAEKILLDTDSLEEGTTCEICNVSLWSPFLLPDCGHTFCQSCLEKWFSQILAKHIAGFPNYYRAVEGESKRHPLYACPKCRKAVNTRPIENFSLKSLVRSITIATGEMSPKKGKRKGAQRKGERKGGPKGNDKPWDRFFGQSELVPL